MISYHLPYHHHVGPQVFVDSKDVQNTDVPENNVNTVDDPAIAHVRFVLQPKHEPKEESGNSNQICDVPVLFQPHTYLLFQFPRLRHQNLTD